MSNKIKVFYLNVSEIFISYIYVNISNENVKNKSISELEANILTFIYLQIVENVIHSYFCVKC